MTNQPTDTDTTRVVIQFTRTVMRECEACKDCAFGPGRVAISPMSMKPTINQRSPGPQDYNKPCLHCHGTGKRRVVVSGELPMKLGTKGTRNVWCSVRMSNGMPWRGWFPTELDLANEIIDGHLAGQLPAEIAAHIKEEPVDAI